MNCVDVVENISPWLSIQNANGENNEQGLFNGCNKLCGKEESLRANVIRTSHDAMEGCFGSQTLPIDVVENNLTAY